MENLAKDNGELTSAAIAYFADPRFSEAPPRTIVWEIPERFFDKRIDSADENWVKELGAQRYRK